jgi:hypothetical protein
VKFQFHEEIEYRGNFEFSSVFEREKAGKIIRKP